MEYLKIGTAALVRYAAPKVQRFISVCRFWRLRSLKRFFTISPFTARTFSKGNFGGGRTIVSITAGLGFGLTVGLWGHSITETVWADQWSPPVPAAGLLFASLEDEAFERNDPSRLPAPVSFFDRRSVVASVHTGRRSTSYVSHGSARFVIRGEITPSLAAYVDGLSASRLKLVELDSVGGDVSAAISIARRIRAVAGHTYVGPRGRCFSSCGVIFQGGVRRVAAPDALFLLHYAKQESSDPMFSLRSSVWGTVALIETMIDLGADPALYDQIPGMGDWLLTAPQAESIGIVQYVEEVR